jgi:DNA polymerase-3 subunit alpha
LSIVNASLRPSGASYRDRLVAGEFNHNPSELIDKLLEQNNGFLVFQEDVIAFLQQICGLSGSDADNVRRAIGRKQLDRLEKALPDILEGYCNKSPKPRKEAEEEAKTFLKIIEDSSNYMFGYNHSTGYSMIGYVCGYLRHYYPLEFITAFLNNPQNDEDIVNGTQLAKQKGIKIINPKFRFSSALYTPNKETNSIYKGMESIKFMNAMVAEELYKLRDKQYNDFVDVLIDVSENTSCNSRQLEILILLDFFTEFGNNNQLFSIYTQFAKRYKKTHKDNTKQKRIAELKEFLPTVSDLKPFTPDINIKNQLQYLGYTTITLPNLPKNYCMIADLKRPYTHQMVTLLTLKDGKTQTVKVKNKVFAKSPFKQFDILKVLEIKDEKRWVMIDNDWKQIDQTEPCLTKYIIVE